MTLAIFFTEIESPGDSGHCWIATVMADEWTVYDCEGRTKAAAKRKAMRWVTELKKTPVTEAP